LIPYAARLAFRKRQTEQMRNNSAAKTISTHFPSAPIPPRLFFLSLRISIGLVSPPSCAVLGRATEKTVRSESSGELSKERKNTKLNYPLERDATFGEIPQKALWIGEGAWWGESIIVGRREEVDFAFLHIVNFRLKLT
jgi:hypothetical protein